VVYGRPAIAVPVTQVWATVVVRPGRQGQGILLQATDLGVQGSLDQVTDAGDKLHPMATTVRNTLRYLRLPETSDLTLRVSSTVPVARGLGSGAAVSTAIVRALAQHFGKAVSTQDVSDLVYEIEVIHHGTPSGIDNTVIAYEKPVFFVRGRDIEPLTVGRPFWLVVGDTGVASPTRLAVAQVRDAWKQDPAHYDACFDSIAALVEKARQAIVSGNIEPLGNLMDENQRILRAIGVSSPELDRLLTAAREAGATGAKLCGAGLGGNMVALADAATAEAVATALWHAGAVNSIVTRVESPAES
jgi:mevalonate kinase